MRPDNNLAAKRRSIILIFLRSLIALLLDLLYVMSLTKNDKELEILILRQQIRILQRKITTPPRIANH
jgi:hypothetical protein